MNGLLYFGNYWDWYNLYREYTKTRKDQTLWLFYEDMVRDTERNIWKIIDFLGYDRSRYSRHVMDEVLEAVSFKRMHAQRKDESVLSFVGGVQQTLFRKGVVGDWVNHLSEEQSEEMDLVTKVKFHGSDFKYFKELDADSN